MVAERQPIIQVKDLNAGYGETIILEKINFEVREGERFVILGPSGCGKSTLLKHLVGLNPSPPGRVFLEGREVTTHEQPGFRKIVREIGFLFQNSALFGSMTVAENIALPLLEYTDLPRECVEAVVQIKLSQVNLGGTGDQYPAELSGGMRKRAALARALALSPRILFFDEPSAGLDPITSAELDNLILYLNLTLGTTMVIVSHELASIFRIAERVIMLDREARGIIAEGDPAELRDHSPNPLVNRFFHRQAEEQTAPREHRR